MENEGDIVENEGDIVENEGDIVVTMVLSRGLPRPLLNQEPIRVEHITI